MDFFEKIIGILIFLYASIAAVFTLYFNYMYAVTNGFIAWVFFGEIVATGTFLLSLVLAIGSDSLSINMVRALNALRCAFVSGYVNLFMLFASAYYFLR